MRVDLAVLPLGGSLAFGADENGRLQRPGRQSEVLDVGGFALFLRLTRHLVDRRTTVNGKSGPRSERVPLPSFQVNSPVSCPRW